MKSQISNKLPSQPFNPIENDNAVTLRSCKKLLESKNKKKAMDLEDELEVEPENKTKS